MKQLPSVGIVTPSYNTGRFIGAAIQSVLALRGPVIDYLVMDGGSTDQTTQVLASFGDRIRAVSERDRGQSDAINRGFAQVRGEILGWLNADDVYAPDAALAAAEYLRDHPDVALVYADANFIDANGKPIGPCVHIEPFIHRRLLHYSDFIVQPAAFWRREAFEAVGGLDPTLNWAMDYDLWLKIARKFKIAHLPRTLASYRWLGDTKTASGGWARLDEVRKVARRHGARRLPAYFRLESTYLHVQDAASALRYRDPWPAAASLARAAGGLITSPRAMLSLMSRRTWRVIYTGQVLRAAAQQTSAPQAASPRLEVSFNQPASPQ